MKLLKKKTALANEFLYKSLHKIMKKFQSPIKYIQSNGILSSSGRHIKSVFPKLKKAGIIIHKNLTRKYKDVMTSSFDNYYLCDFEGDCTFHNAKIITSEFSKHNVDHVVAFGGGKVVDLGKLVAHSLDTPSIMIPSLASTIAPCTSVSVVYQPNGKIEEYVFYEKTPDMIIVDTQVIANAPSKYLVAGMGDAMSTYYEVDACIRNPNAKSKIYPFIYRPTYISLGIAHKCLDIIFKHGLTAKHDCDNNIISESLEQIIEANILMSGLGTECGGLALAHGLHNALIEFPQTNEYLHGEKIAFGTIVQLLVENNHHEAIKVAKFNDSVGLPTSLQELNITYSDQNIEKLADICLQPGNTSLNIKYITKKHLIDCIKEANFLV
jgi:glycerol dehydrogenase